MSKFYAYVDSLSERKHSDAALHFAASQLVALVKKYPWDPVEVKLDPESKARQAFSLSEHRCRRMNAWFRAHRRNRGDTVLFSRMRSFIRYVINDAPDLGSIYGQCDFTGGASLGVHGNATNLMRKLLAKSWTVTPCALDYFRVALRANFHYAGRVAPTNGVVQSVWFSHEDLMRSCTLVSANTIAFVPKTAKTYRSIAVEPLGNGFVQKGVDLFLRSRMKRIGIDLSDQSLNQRMARQGSIPGQEDPLCTIDLSSASDSISIELCREVLPPDWFNFLNCIRSPSYNFSDQKDKTFRYQKFCSMGNGFCFPLETLIFASIIHACKGGRVGIDWSVYGDDIIVRKSVFEAVVGSLRTCGFRTNKSKTFSEGFFRESCGADWYGGEDVRPFTLDFELDCLSSYFKFINLARRNTRTSIFLSECITDLMSAIPGRWRFMRPFKGPPDSAIDPLDCRFSCQPRRWNSKLQCLSWYELETKPLGDVMDPPWWVLNAAALRGHPASQPFTVRRKTRTRVRFVARSGDCIS